MNLPTRIALIIVCLALMAGVTFVSKQFDEAEHAVAMDRL